VLRLETGEELVEQRAVWRLTLTVPVINAAARIMFLIEGEQKAQALHLVLEEAYDPDTLPAQLIQPTQGELDFLVDDAAASLLQRT
jgi:6-phosphogluconolactonase